MPAALVITPGSALIDDKLSIRLTGFAPGQTVTIRARMADDLGQVWQSAAAFVTDSAGAADLETQKPISGSYAVADVMGLIWSMTPEDGRETLFVQNRVTPLAVTFTAEAEGQRVEPVTVERVRCAEGVTHQVIREDGLFGTLFMPPGPGPHPAVIIVTGSGGGLHESRAALFAAHGCAALALAYFNYETLPRNLVEIPLEYFEKAIHWLSRHALIDGERLAFTGGSRGGELSLLVAATYPQIRAVAAYVPSGIAWGGIGADPADMARTAWTHRGEPVPFLSSVNTDQFAELYAEIERRGDPIPLTPGFTALLQDRARAEAAAIPIERINGPILLISGGDDQMWPSSRLANMAIERLDQHQFAHPYRHVCYAGAGHMIQTPYTPTTVTSARHPIRGGSMAFGGTARDNAFATADSWQQVLRFFDDYLR